MTAHRSPAVSLAAPAESRHGPSARRLGVPTRYTGPPGSANGGYLAGRLAASLAASTVADPGGAGADERAVQVTGAVQVTLRQPPPLDTPMDLAPDGSGGLRVVFGGAPIAEAVPVELAVDPVDPVPYGLAAELGATYAGLAGHPFPDCFVCGTSRSAPDALALRPGRVPDRPDCTATAWRPHPSLAVAGGDRVPVELVWAALDCPGGWAAVDLPGRAAVLGRMTAQVDALPHAGDRCVVMGRRLGQEGRKSFSATTLYDGDGRVLGRASAVWIEVDPVALLRR